MLDCFPQINHVTPFRLISVQSPISASSQASNNNSFIDDGSSLAPEIFKVVALRIAFVTVIMAAATISRRQIFVRPRSEVITVLGWRQVSNDIAEQWRSETCLDGKFFENEERQLKTGYVCGSYEFTREELDESGSEMATEEETDIPDANPDLQRSVLTINLKPASVQVKPRLVKAQSMASLPRKAEVNIAGHSQSKDRERSGLNRRKSSLDVSLAKLRHEMVSTTDLTSVN